MYTHFFGLSEKPFSITPDPHFLFLSERHAEALAHLVYGVTESGGFIQLTGEVGTGKTTLTRSLLDRLPDTVDLAVILNPRLSVREFLHAIFDELNITAPAGDATTKDLVDALNRYLLRTHSEGRRTVLLVDEAQNLDSDVLEQLRLLTNLETAKDKLLQIILVGQPELRTLLGRNDLRQLAQRITGRYHLATLSADETIAYIRHRLKVAGAQHEIFTPGALWEVHRVSGGVPRLINVVCDRALLGAYTAESAEVDRKTVLRAAQEVGGAPPRPVARSRWPLPGVALGAAAAVLLLFGAWAIVQLLGAAPTAPDRAAASAPPAGTAPPATAADGVVPAATPQRRRTLSVSARLAPLETRANAADEVQAGIDAQLGELLEDPRANTGTDEAFRQLFSLWGASNAFSGSEPPCVSALAAGLRCAFQVGSWRLLRTMNRPAILSLVDGSGNVHNALLVALDAESATLRMGQVQRRLSIEDVSQYWFGEYLVLWRPRHGPEELILPGTRGPAVVWLRDTLPQVLGLDASRSNDPAYFDSALRRQLQSFQRTRRLEADGKAGVQTLIALNTALAVPGTPYLEP